jgi:hypothetical protein
MPGSGVDALSYFRRNATGLGFYIRRDLVRRRFSLFLRLEPPLQLHLRVLFVERDINGLLNNLSHVLQRILNT